MTVLCAELTQLATPLDPEELRPVEAEAQRHACAVVEGFGATAHALSAGTLVAVFGAPVAHEDDAERAVRAGLRICELGLAGRAGVASGEAIVALGGPQAGTATGGMTSAAVALQRVAPPGGTAVDAATRDATADALCFEPIAGTASAWRATGDAPALARPTRFVGRDRELALLRELHDATLSERRPHLVTIVGEAGIGKSRLLEELSSRVARRDRLRRAPRALPGLRGGRRLLGVARDPVGRRRCPARRQRRHGRRQADRARRASCSRRTGSTRPRRNASRRRWRPARG